MLAAVWRFSSIYPRMGVCFSTSTFPFFVANLHHVMRYFSFLQYVMRFWGYRWRYPRHLCKKQQSLSPLSLATFDSASRQRRSRRRLAAFTSTQGSQKASRSLAPSQRCNKRARKNQNTVGGGLFECRVIRNPTGERIARLRSFLHIINM